MDFLQRTMEEERMHTSAILDFVESKSVVSDSMDKILGNTPMDGLFGASSEQARAKTNYSLFRGWVYAAINAISSEGAMQDINVARRKTAGKKGNPRPMKTVPETMPFQFKGAYSRGTVDIDPDHILSSCMIQPNDLQDGIGFVYSFIANLCLTGWAYVVGGETGDPEKPFEFYSLPTTWVKPLHKKGPFSEFLIKDPAAPDSKGETLPRELVGFAHMPNPADMKGATAPATAQIQAIRIDDHIQTSQEHFFENGVFPSVIVEMGKDPHPDVPSGVRPRLSPQQRRQVMGAIRKVMGGVANYGSPAIVDGLIENIRPLSMTQREMGWDKSEDKARTRILVAFGVHPYILGEATNIGGYAQAAKIEERFCKRVNLFLRMLGGVITGLVSRTEPLLVWWEPCAPTDPGLRWKNLLEMRKNGDITREEIRTEAGFPEMDPEAEKARNKLLDSVGGMQGTISVLQAVGRGMIGPEAATKMLALFLEIDEAEAKAIAEAALDKTDDQLEQNNPNPEQGEDEEDEQEDDEETQTTESQPASG